VAFQTASRHHQKSLSANPTSPALFASSSSNSNNRHNEEENAKGSIAAGLGSLFLAASLAFGTTFAITPPLPVHAYVESKVVGELKGSGLVFKDTLTIERFDDPKVKGVTLYISNFGRPLTEKLQKNFFRDPSLSSVGCAMTGPVAIADNINKTPQGEEVFKESKSLLFKTLRVQRIFDVERNTIVYVTFNTRLDKNDDSNNSRFKSSLCAVNLEEPAAPVVAAPPAAPVVAAPPAAPPAP
jgi:CreA protein